VLSRRAGATRLQFDRLCLRLKNGRKILENVSGDFPHR
jgi:hypothetical protein